jgi:hypothetical protein
MVKAKVAEILVRMKRKEKIRRCKCPCNRELPSRYKGREKIFYDSPVCRKTWHSMSEEAQTKRLTEMELVIR